MLPSGLIVSCQARDQNPLTGAQFMTAMAKAAERGGAVGLRANGTSDIRAIKENVNLPLIGLLKTEVKGFDVFITPNFASARAVFEAGADVIALDATLRPHPEGDVHDFIKRVKSELGAPVMADISTLEEGVQATRAGADYVGTTLSGYTAYTEKSDDPDLHLVADLVKAVNVPVIAEGRYWTPEQMQEAFAFGAYAVVIGTAITNPWEITKRFAAAVPDRD